MSHEIEIESAEKSELERRKEHGDDLTIRIAVFTVLVACVAVCFNLFGEEISEKSFEVRHDAGQTQSVATEFRVKAAVHWVKGAPETAKALDAKADAAGARAILLAEESEHLSSYKEPVKFSVPLLQLAIALASIAVLTRLKAVGFAALAFAVVGILSGTYGVASYRTHKTHVPYETSHPAPHAAGEGH